MKTIFFGLYFIFISSLIAAIATFYSNDNRWMAPILAEISLGASTVLLFSLMRFVKALLNKSNLVLHQKMRSPFVLSPYNFGLLKKNQEQIVRKFEATAKMISNLSHTEKSAVLQSLDANDPIGKALQAIRQEMQSSKEEDAKRSWITSGLASFTEVLRNKSEVKEYAYQIICHLAKYIRASQGALYMASTNDGERYLELTACYANGERKSGAKRISEGDGMLGQCMLEKNFVFINEVPKHFVKISSGLGEATPRTIIIAPLLFNDTLYGAIEMASFEMLQPHQVEFLKSVCTNIASEIAALRKNDHTESLLKESTYLAQELQSREEEMKHNLAALAATQEEAERRQSELKSYLNGINNTVASAEFSMEGNFNDANEIFLKVMGYTKEDLKEKNSEFLMGRDRSVFMMWEILRQGKFFSGEFKMRNKNGKELWLAGTFNPITIENNVPEKIMMFAQFTTQEKEKLRDLTAMVQALKSTLPVLEFNPDFACKAANDKALTIFGLTRLQLRSKTIRDFIPAGYYDHWLENVDKILNSEFGSFVIPFLTGSQIITYEISVSLTRSPEGEIIKLIILLVKEVSATVPVLAIG
jgi:PAS domain S-box-containing protein